MFKYHLEVKGPVEVPTIGASRRASAARVAAPLDEGALKELLADVPLGGPVYWLLGGPRLTQGSMGRLGWTLRARGPLPAPPPPPPPPPWHTQRAFMSESEMWHRLQKVKRMVDDNLVPSAPSASAQSRAPRRGQRGRGQRSRSPHGKRAPDGPESHADLVAQVKEGDQQLWQVFCDGTLGAEDPAAYPRRYLVAFLQGEAPPTIEDLVQDLERLSKFELAKLGSLELAKLRELQLSLPSPTTLKAEENPRPSL